MVPPLHLSLSFAVLATPYTDPHTQGPPRRPRSRANAPSLPLRAHVTLPTTTASSPPSPHHQDAPVDLATPPTAPKPSKGPKPVVHVAGDALGDSPGQIALVLAGLGASLHVAWQTWPFLLSSWAGPATLLAAFLFADFATGIYHWAVDNYGDKDTPVFGTQIAAFQGHHASPWTIAQRGFFNNVSKATVPALPQMILLSLAPAAPLFKMFYGTFLFTVVMSQEYHKWSHMINPPAFAKALQNSGILISRGEHLRHHNSPFEGKYCIVSGHCNELMDRLDVYRRMEVFFYVRNGVEPNCWKLDPSIKHEALRRYQ